MRRHPLCFLILGLAACGSDSPTFVDAGPIDASATDASATDASTATASVTVHVRSLDGDGAPDATATVFLVGPGGALEAEGHPDPAGTFTGLITPGGSVTVGWPNETIYLETVVGVADRDELWFGSDDLSTDGAMTLTVPARAGANGYTVRGPCMNGSSSTTTIPATFSRHCGATHPLLVEARFVGMPAMYLTAPAVTPADGATVALAGAWAAATTAPATVSGLPAGSSDLTMSRTVVVSGADTRTDYKFNVAIAGGMATATFAAPASFGEAARFDVNYRLPSDSFYRVALFRPTLTEAAPLDVAPSVPAITTNAQDGATVSWTLDGDGAFDAITFDLAEIDNLENELAHWRVVTPPTATRFTLPDLPAPFDQASIPLERIRLIDTATLTDGAAFRARAGAGTWISQPPFPAPADARWIVRDADR